MNRKKVIMKCEEVREEVREVVRERRERKIGGESEGKDKKELGERSEGEGTERKLTNTPPLPHTHTLTD